jgi:hypothetical protein
MLMKHDIKVFALAITHGHTRDLISEHVKEINHKNDHVVIYVDNAGPLRKLRDNKGDEQIKKAVDQVCGQNCTYETKLYKPDVRHEREKQVPHRIRQ